MNSLTCFSISAITCPAGSTYRASMTACPATCGNPGGFDDCFKPNVEGCECNSGYVLNGPTCIPVGDCTCESNGVFYAVCVCKRRWELFVYLYVYLFVCLFVCLTSCSVQKDTWVMMGPGSNEILKPGSKANKSVLAKWSMEMKRMSFEWQEWSLQLLVCLYRITQFVLQTLVAKSAFWYINDLLKIQNFGTWMEQFTQIWTKIDLK